MDEPETHIIPSPTPTAATLTHAGQLWRRSGSAGRMGPGDGGGSC